MHGSRSRRAVFQSEASVLLILAYATIDRHALRFQRRLSDQELRAVGVRQRDRCVAVVEGELKAAALLQAQPFRQALRGQSGGDLLEVARGQPGIEDTGQVMGTLLRTMAGWPSPKLAMVCRPSPSASMRSRQ
jgi:hypothetical protein